MLGVLVQRAEQRAAPRVHRGVHEHRQQPEPAKGLGEPHRQTPQRQVRPAAAAVTSPTLPVASFERGRHGNLRLRLEHRDEPVVVRELSLNGGAKRLSHAPAVAAHPLDVPEARRRTNLAAVAAAADLVRAAQRGADAAEEPAELREFPGEVPGARPHGRGGVDDVGCHLTVVPDVLAVDALAREEDVADELLLADLQVGLRLGVELAVGERARARVVESERGSVVRGEGSGIRV